MAKFKPYKIESSQLESLTKSEGQFIVTTDTQKVYLDETDSSRIELIPVPTKTSDLINDMNFMSGMTILSYGHSTWNDFITAYTAKHVVYTRASSGSNPASGSQTRLAFMAYVNNADNPTEVEFQYYRSVSTHSDSQQGDQTYVYKLNKTNGWSVTVRENYTKVVAGTGMSSTWSGGKITLNCTVTPPTKTSDLTNDSGFIDNTVDNLTNYTKTSDLATVATSGDYNDLINKPTVPTVNDAILTIQKNGTAVNTFSANASTNVTANIEVPTKTSDLTNDSGYITGITSSDVTTALGYTPYDSTNPNGYTTNTGTVIGVTAGTGLNTVSDDTGTDGGTISTSGTLYLTKTGVTADTYQGITVDKYGRITSASDQGYVKNTDYATQSVGGVIKGGNWGINVDDTGHLYGSILSADSYNGYANKFMISKGTLNNVLASKGYATESYVDTAIDNLPEPMVFKGSLGTGGTITSLPTDGSANIGDTYKVITAGTYASKAADVGDTFICLTKTSSANTWELIPSGDEPSGTVTSVTIKATSPIVVDSSSAITSSGTRTLSHATSGVIADTYRSVTVDDKGHVTAGSNPTTISGYGITDAKIANGVITLGSNTITPLTSSSIGNVSIAGLPHGFQITGPIDGQITVNGIYTLDAACAKGVDTSISAASTSTNLPTSQAVASFVEGKGYLTSEINSNLVNGSATGSLRTIGSATEDSNYTIGSYAFAEGYGSKTSASYAHAEGMNTQATGSWGSHAEGYNTKATNNMAHAEGDSSIASGVSSHAENGSTASGSFSHSEGNTSAAGAYQHTQGRYNITDSNNTYVDIIGNGTSNDDRSNAATVDWNGNAWYAGDVYVGSTSGTNKDSGSVKLAKVSELPSAGTGINITNGVVTNTGVVNIETSPSAAGNGTIAVTKGTTSGTSTTYVSVRGLNDAAYKNVDSSISAASTSTQLPTSQAVAAFVEGKGYLTSYTETDPVFTASPAYGITSTNITDWNNKISQYSTMPQASSETIGEIVQYIGTTDNTYTHGYFYEGDSIEVLDGETLGTITTYVWKHIDVQSSNYLAKDNATLYTPTGNYNPATKKYVDDACAKDYEIYYWDGKSSSQTASNLQLFQDILDKHLAGKDILIIRNNTEVANIYPDMYVLDHTMLPTTSSSTASYTIYSQVRMVKGTSPSYSEFQQKYNKIVINMTAADVTTVTSVTTTSSTTRGTFIEPETSYGTPFVPTANGHPATKKYVDDSISAISTGIHSFYGTTDPTTVTGSVDGDIYIVIDA